MLENESMKAMIFFKTCHYTVRLYGKIDYHAADVSSRLHRITYFKMMEYNNDVAA
jgi:hypothetical protein